VTCSIENDEVTVRLPLEGFSASTVLVSISARSAVILSLEDEPGNGPGRPDSDFLRVVSLPVDSARVSCELDGSDLCVKASRPHGQRDVCENRMCLIIRYGLI
jgi:hypothetical protein